MEYVAQGILIFQYGLAEFRAPLDMGEEPVKMYAVRKVKRIQGYSSILRSCR